MLFNWTGLIEEVPKAIDIKGTKFIIIKPRGNNSSSICHLNSRRTIFFLLFLARHQSRRTVR